MGLFSKRDKAAERTQARNLKRWEETQKAPAALAAGAFNWEQMLKDGPSPGGLPSFLAQEGRDIASGTIGQWSGMFDQAGELRDDYKGFFDQMGSYTRSLAGPGREAKLRADQLAIDRASTTVAEQQAKLGRMGGLAAMSSTEAGIQAATEATRKGMAGAYGAMGPQMQTAGAMGRMFSNQINDTANIATNRANAANQYALARQQGQLGLSGNELDIANRAAAFEAEGLPQQMLQGAASAQGALGMQQALTGLPLQATNQIMQAMQALKGGTAVTAPDMFQERVIPKKKTFLGSLVGGIGSGLIGGITGGIGMGLASGFGGAIANTINPGGQWQNVANSLGGGGNPHFPPTNPAFNSNNSTPQPFSATNNNGNSGGGWRLGGQNWGVGQTGNGQFFWGQGPGKDK